VNLINRRRTPAAIIAYIRVEDLTGRPEIVQTFKPDEGWRDAAGRDRRCTLGHMHDLRDAGVTAVAIRIGNRVCDFPIGSLLN
jgi:hypothetical protein